MREGTHGGIIGGELGSGMGTHHDSRGVELGIGRFTYGVSRSGELWSVWNIGGLWECCWAAYECLCSVNQIFGGAKHRRGYQMK